MPKADYLHFFIDPNRCIGCQSCVQACTECDTHRGESMIHLEFVDRRHSMQTVPVSACIASSLPAQRCVLRMPSSAPATVWCSRRASRAASPAAIAWWRVRSECRSSTTIVRS